MITILDCYTDEPAGLGVPPYLGTYPRYIAGYYIKEGYKKINYITIDDLRFLKYYDLNPKKQEVNHKTNIKIYNLTKNISSIQEILENTTRLIVILGIHTPGKYLSAIPGTLKEVAELIKDLDCEKVLTGPAVIGTQLEGGRFQETTSKKIFDRTDNFDFKYQEIREYAVKGSEIIKQIPQKRIIEIETSRGCSRTKGCSFCTEPLKHKLEFREKSDILKEIKALYKENCTSFRIGKQSDFYMYPEAIPLLRDIRKEFQKIQILHIDNVNPLSVICKKGIETTKAIVKYCTEGNIAAFGVESFDKEVCKQNNLNSLPEEAYDAIRVLNKYGAKRGKNGMQEFLPGINLLFGLKGETKDTHNENMKWLKRVIDNNLLLRRINIRQVSIFEGTPLFQDTKNKYIRKNKKYYWKWRNEIRNKIDLPMLKKLVPKGTILKEVISEIYDGNTTFARQTGTYPLIIGIKQRIPLNKPYTVEITGHMLRSVTGVIK